MRKLNTKLKFLALAGLISAAALVLGPARITSAQAVGPSWSYTGDLISSDDAGTATLLPNGKVLILGRGAELYDPATGTWSITGNRNTAGGGTATLLRNGKVLVAGDSAELYDPATGTWSITGDLITARGLTATLLPNGKVLVTGVNSAELYDPATGTWSITGNLIAARLSYTATLLPNGKVLVAGGTGSVIDDLSLKSAELYDPATGTWSSTGNLNTARCFHSATLLPSGKVLVAAGSESSSSDPDPTIDAELYDPTTGMWSYTGSLNTGRIFHTMTLLSNGRVLVAGRPGLRL